MTDMPETPAGPLAVVERLRAACNARDLEALVACFADDYTNLTPAHPQRGFVGHDQVRRNWEQVFAFVPDLRAEVQATAVSGDEVWSEWEMQGRRRDGSAHHMRGVIVFTVRGDAIAAARFYLEPVDESDSTVDDAIREQVVRE